MQVPVRKLCVCRGAGVSLGADPGRRTFSVGPQGGEDREGQRGTREGHQRAFTPRPGPLGQGATPDFVDEETAPSSALPQRRSKPGRCSEAVQGLLVPVPTSRKGPSLASCDCGLQVPPARVPAPGDMSVRVSSLGPLLLPPVWSQGHDLVQQPLARPRGAGIPTQEGPLQTKGALVARGGEGPAQQGHSEGQGPASKTGSCQPSSLTAKEIPPFT